MRAAGQAAITLPALEIMSEGKARAATAPRRYVLMFCGSSMGQNGQREPFWTPKGGGGAGYPITRDLAPLGTSNAFNRFGAYGVQDEVTIVSGLSVPWVNDGQPVPPGGWTRPSLGFHGGTFMAPVLAGVKATNGYDQSYTTFDQVVAKDSVVTAGSVFPSLELGVQPNCDMASCGGAGLISANGRAVVPQFSPHAAFSTIYPYVKDPKAPVDTTAFEKLRAREKSILDYWLSRSKRLGDRLGKADNARLDAFFSQIRDAEKRLDQIPKIDGAMCKAASDPGPDPDLTLRPYTEDPAVDKPGGYNEEVKRAEVMRDLLVSSLTCDLTRVASLLMTWPQSNMNVKAIIGVDCQMHGCTHNDSSEAQHADLLSWHLQTYAHVIDRLKQTPDVDGNRMIDNTVVMMATEGGLGYEIVDASGTMNREQSPHALENYCILVAGGRNLGLTPGRHLPMGNKAHPASVFVSAMKAVGVTQQRGEMRDPLPVPL